MRRNKRLTLHSQVRYKERTDESHYKDMRRNFKHALKNGIGANDIMDNPELKNYFHCQDPKKRKVFYLDYIYIYRRSNDSKSLITVYECNPKYIEELREIQRKKKLG